MNNARNRMIAPRKLAVLILLCAASAVAPAATWKRLRNPAPNNGQTGTMLLLTDGTVMIQNSGGANWFRLTPSAKGSYVDGTWTSNPINPMSTSRLYYAAEVLQSGKIWILGGEYYGPNLNAAFTATGEEWDPVTNVWSPLPAFPPQACFAVQYNVTGNITNGSRVITGLPSAVTPTFLAGWTVAGTGIPASTSVASVDSSTEVHMSHAATATQSAVALDFTGTPASCYGDVPSVLLPGGKILTGSLVNNSTYLYDIAKKTFAPAAKKVYNEPSEEEGWIKLSGGKIINYDVVKSVKSGMSYAELYDPVANKWSSISPADGTAAGTLPLLSNNEVGFELGPSFRLLDGRAFLIGANGNTALYDPSTNTWAAGPVVMGSLNGIPSVFGADDAPGAVLPNGHVILAADAGPSPVISTGNVTAGSNIITGINSTATIQVDWNVQQTSGSHAIPANAFVKSVDSPTQVTISKSATRTASGIGLLIGGVFSFPTQLFDFDPAANTISPVSPAIPDQRLALRPSFVTRMLVLPTGQLLFSDGFSRLWVYTSGKTAPRAYQPVVTKVVKNGSKYTLTGLRLSGQSAGAAYGDDAEMAENYPIVRVVSSTGNVYYCRTTNWSSVDVGRSSKPQTVDFTLNPSITAGSYSLIVSAAGISSASMPITITQADLGGR